MPQITHFKTPCPEHINSQILQMVVDYLTDISMVAIAPSNLLYNVYQYAIGFEVHLYLEALNGVKGIAVELLVATDEDDPEKVVGFLLYLPVKDDPDADRHAREHTLHVRPRVRATNAPDHPFQNPVPRAHQ